MGNGTSTVEVLENNLVTFYENYCGSIEERHEDAITADGILHLCADLDLAVDDFRILLFAWKCDAAQMGKLSKNEFLQVKFYDLFFFSFVWKRSANHMQYFLGVSFVRNGFGS